MTPKAVENSLNPINRAQMERRIRAGRTRSAPGDRLTVLNGVPIANGSGSRTNVLNLEINSRHSRHRSTDGHR
jgi:hypothetical protein